MDFTTDAFKHYVLALNVNDVVAEENESFPILKHIDEELLEAFKDLKCYFAEKRDSMSPWQDLYKIKEFQNGLHYTLF